MDYSVFEGKKILVTGASGLIGSAIVSSLLSHKGEKPIKVVALARNKQKITECFKSLPQDNLEYLICDVCDLQPVDMGVDYIVHGANQTASKAFVDQPVEVINGALQGTKNLLELAKLNGVKGFAFLSTMEVYGVHETDEKIAENAFANIDSMNPRSSYPESKRLCECLCASYFAEYKVPAKVLRLTQTFGEGVTYDDKRVFAEFARCVIEGKDIVLKTKGGTKRNYLYIDDAVSAILTVLAYGASGEAYNVANEETYCSILEMAELVASQLGSGKISVRIEECDTESLGYAPPLKMNLSTKKLQGLGWRAKVDLRTAFERTIEYMKGNRPKE